MTPEIQNRISILRHKMKEGTVNIDELREAVRLLAEGRRNAATASATSNRKAKVKAEIPSADDMLDELGKV